MTRAPDHRRLLSIVTLLATTTGSCTPKDPLEPGLVSQQQQACDAYLHANDLERADAACKLCLEFHRHDPECTNLLGLIAYRSGDVDAARDLYKRAMRLRNDFPEARNNMGVLLQEQDDNLPAATTLFESALKIHPGYLDARWNLALALSQVADRARIAVERSQEARGANKADPLVMQRDFASVDDAYARCADQLRRLVQLSPTHRRAHFLLGYVHQQRAGHATTSAQATTWWERAAQEYQACVVLSPPGTVEAVQCRGNLAAVHENLGQHETALAHYAQCLALASQDVECRRGMARAHAAVSVTSGALREVLTRLADHPEDAEAHVGVCALALESGLEDLALSSCENALQLDGGLCHARAYLVRHARQRLDVSRFRAACHHLLACPSGPTFPEAAACQEDLGALGLAP